MIGTEKQNLTANRTAVGFECDIRCTQSKVILH